jgi:hypothetical protein
MMHAEELENSTEKELRDKANINFIWAEDPNHPADDAERLRLLFKAQLYMSELAKRHDDKNSRRDFCMEIVVIVLISVEIVLSVVFGLLALREGNQQATVLSRMDASTAATAAAMNEAETSLNSLSEQQAKSLESLTKMNENLHTSVGTAHNQLSILKATQADTLAERSKRPILSLDASVGSPDSVRPLENTVVIKKDTMVSGVIIGDDAIASDFQLKNSGPVPAHRVEVRVTVTGKAVTLTEFESTANLHIREDTPDPNHAAGPYDDPRYYTIPIGDVRPKIPVRLPLAFHFPKNHDGFIIIITVSSDETSSPVNLWYAYVLEKHQP